MNQSGPSNKKKGRSKKAHILSAAVQKATENFIIKGEEIAEENPEVRADMIAAIEEVRTTGWSSLKIYQKNNLSVVYACKHILF